jgi:hypothetical protein
MTARDIVTTVLAEANVRFELLPFGAPRAPWRGAETASLTHRHLLARSAAGALVSARIDLLAPARGAA